MNDDEFKGGGWLISSGLTATYIAPFTVMLAIVDKSNPTPQGIIANGTGSLVNTGVAQFLVTNNHVYESFERRRAEFYGTMLLMSGKTGVSFADISNVSLRGRDKRPRTRSARCAGGDRLATRKAVFALGFLATATSDSRHASLSLWLSRPGRVPMGDSLGIPPLTLEGTSQRSLNGISR